MGAASAKESQIALPDQVEDYLTQYFANEDRWLIFPQFPLKCRLFARERDAESEKAQYADCGKMPCIRRQF